MYKLGDDKILEDYSHYTQRMDSKWGEIQDRNKQSANMIVEQE